MKGIGIVCALVMFFSFSSALAVDKVVIVPLGGAKHYMYWKGEWAVDTNYKVGDAVHMDGSSYMCTTGHKSTPSNYPPHLFNRHDENFTVRHYEYGARKGG